MAIPRSPTGARWWFGQTSTYDVLIAVFAAIIGITTTASYVSQKRMGLAALAGVGTFGVVALTVLKHVVTLVAARKKASTHELEGCLHTLYAVLAPPTGVRLRLAVHVPVGETLEQVTEYIGDKPKPGRVGRQF